MTLTAPERGRWLVVVVFAAGMAWVESACVYYLRVLVDRLNPYQPVPLPVHGALGRVELVREAATLVMLLTVGMLAGRTLRSRLGYASIAFGTWDLLYYVFLHIIYGWPRSLVDWDILFLLPLPWWGPVIAPCCIAVLMIVWGTCVTQWPDRIPTGEGATRRLATGAAGLALALYVFMADALAAVQNGADAALVLPVTFNWPLFAVALVLMSAALWPMLRTPGPRARKPPILLASPPDHRATRSLT